MTTFSKKQRDLAMKIICDFYANSGPLESINDDYLKHHGIPENVKMMFKIMPVSMMHQVMYHAQSGTPPLGLLHIAITSLMPFLCVGSWCMMGKRGRSYV